MYAVGHTSHKLIHSSATAEEKIRNRREVSKKVYKGNLFYRTVINNEVWSFFESHEDAKGFLTVLILDGSQT